jgi:ribosome-associated protein
MPAPDWPPIPEAAIEEKFLAATGPGGQNVNKVATAVQMRLDVFALGLSPEAYVRLKEIAGSRMTGAGEIIVTARRFRTREANRVDARERLAELVGRARQRPERRVATRPTRSAKRERMEGKAARGEVKRGRGRPNLE